MQVSLQWLKSYLDLPYSNERISEILTSLGLEVEGQKDWESIPGKLEGIVVGKVLTCGKHPNADRLSLTTVDLGEAEPVQIVCGAPNVAANQYVLVATVGAMLHPEEGEPFKIKKGKIRGEVSFGMICAEDEIGLGKSHDGILVLDKEYAPGTPANQVFEVVEDTIFDIGLTPNRSDATSHRGVAADLWAYLKVHENYQKPFAAIESDTFQEGTADSIPVEVVDSKRCPRYAGLVISDLKVGPSPAWLKHRLAAIGVRPINNIVDITNFILHDLGQPLHAFDLDKMNSKAIKVQTLADKTSFTTLDEIERKLNAEDLMICDGANTPLCIGGVFGGMDSGVSDTTNTIFLEAACFEPRGLRRSATRHDLLTDAARTFEKGVDISNTVNALKRAATLLVEIAGGTVKSKIFDHLATPIALNTIDVSYANVLKLTGAAIDKKVIQSILTALQFNIVEQTDTNLLIEVPTNRVDVTREADVVEEILRVYGYNNVPLPKQIKLSPGVSKYPSKHQLRRRVAEVLLGKGCHETMSLSLVPSKIYDALSPEVVKELVKIHNTSTVELDAMRLNLIPSGLQTITYNQNRQQLDLRFFEFGKGYRLQNGEPTEYEQLAIWSTGLWAAEHWNKTGSSVKTSYSHVKGMANSVLSALGLSFTKEQSQTDHPAFMYAQELFIGDDLVARVGRISAEYINYFDTKSEEVYLALLEWETISKLVEKTKFKLKEISRFPQVTRDLAVVVDKSITFGTIRDLTKKPAGNFAKSMELFDVYEDKEKLGEGKRSYAIRFVFERLDRTLKDKEVDKAMSAVIKSIEAKPGMEIRR